MPMPAVLSQTGTGVVYWTPDWMQSPFNLGVGLRAGTAAITVSVDGSFDNFSVGTANMNWFNIATTSLTTTLVTATLTTPIQSVRLNVVSAVATSVATATIVQATYPGS